MDSIEALSRSRDAFEARLRAVTADQMDRPTPCSDWSVGGLVEHMLLGNRLAITLLGGASRDEAMAEVRGGIETGDDVVVDFVGLADHMHAAFAAEGALDGTVEHPMGEIPREQFIGFRIHEYVVHGWDLARATGGDEQFPDEVVQRVWDDMQPVAHMVTELGIFGPGPSGTVGEDAPLQTRLLDLTGRRP